MGKSIRITGVWLLVLAFYMPLMAQKNIAVASAAILLDCCTEDFSISTDDMLLSDCWLLQHSLLRVAIRLH